MSTANKEVSSVVQMTFSGAYGGRENVAFSLTRLLENRIQCSVLYLILETRAQPALKQDLLARIAQNQIRYRIFYIDRRFSKDVLEEIAQSLKEDGAQIVHCHCYKSAIFAVLIKYFKGLNGLAIILTLHGLQIPLSFNGVMLHALNLLAVFSVDGIIGCSGEIVSRYTATPLLNRKVTVIRNGLLNDTDIIGEYIRMRDHIRCTLADRYGLDKSALWIGNIGRLTQQKNFFLYLRTIEKIKKYDGNLPKVNFLIIGDGALKEELRLFARNMGIDNIVFFTGHVSDMNEIYAALDIQVLSSDWEGTPMCVLEGMSFGLPVVATEVGGLPDLIRHGENGLLIEKGSVEQLRDSTIDIINDDRKRRRLGSKAREYLSLNFSPGIWADKHIDYYSKLISKD